MTILNEALTVINNRRLQSELQAQENRNLALQNEEFAKVYNAYITEVIDQAKNGKLQKNTENLQKKLDILLKKLNLGSITPIYHCNKCQDSGYINGKKCSCLKKEINNILIKKSGFGTLQNFKDVKFDVFENPEYMKKLYEKMQAWCNSDFKKNVVFLSGETGTGKTYLMKCMANELISREKLILLTTAYKLGQDCLKGHTSRVEDDKNELIGKFLDCEVLFIDDLGTEVNLSPLTVNYFYTILNERKMRGLPTVITTNLTLADIRDVYDERVYSRIASDDSIKLSLTGEDLRLKKNK